MKSIFNKRKSEIARLASRTCLGFGLMVAVLSSADAQTRRQPNTVNLSCAQTQELVDKFGAISLKSGQFKFDRYVSGQRYCGIHGARARTTVVPTKDNERCPVLRCEHTGSRD